VYDSSRGSRIICPATVSFKLSIHHLVTNPFRRDYECIPDIKSMIIHVLFLGNETMCKPKDSLLSQIVSRALASRISSRLTVMCLGSRANLVRCQMSDFELDHSLRVWVQVWCCHTISVGMTGRSSDGKLKMYPGHMSLQSLCGSWRINLECSSQRYHTDFVDGDQS
jgi:hypothetical protein